MSSKIGSILDSGSAFTSSKPLEAIENPGLDERPRSPSVMDSEVLWTADRALSSTDLRNSELQSEGLEIPKSGKSSRW